MNRKVTVHNLDCEKYQKFKCRNISKNMFQHPTRGICVGSSNCGKTNAMVNLILNHLAFDKLYIICPNAEIQPKYVMLAEKMVEVDDKVKREIQKKIRIYNKKNPDDEIDPKSIEVDPICEMFEEMPSDLLERLDEKKQNLVILDDFVLAGKADQDIINKLYIRGRHKNCSVFQLVQSFYRASRISRLQCNAFIFFHSVSQAEVAKFHREVGSNIPREEFIKGVMKATKPRYSYCIVDLDSEAPYRKSDFITNLFSS
jgi:hypothetical protein